MSGIIAFDADVLIYAADAANPLGAKVASLFGEDGEPAGVGSVLLLTEVLAKPLRADPHADEVTALLGLLSRLDLRSFDEPTARLALTLSVAYRLRAADAVHLATAVAAGAEVFLTNNSKDFTRSISEIDVVYPTDLA